MDNDSRPTDDMSRFRNEGLRVMAWPAFVNVTGNPYNALLYRGLIDRGVTVDDFTIARAAARSYDIWHMHWPDDLLSNRRTLPTAARLAGLRALMPWTRSRGTRIVWTIHDLGPHESYHPRLERWFWGWFLPRVDGYITLSEHAHRQAQSRFPELRDVPGHVVPHGHYRGAYPNTIGRTEARGRLGLAADQKMILHLGRIRPYKNVPHLVRTFGAVEMAHTRLYVVGNPVSIDLRREIERLAAEDLRVRLRLEFIPDDEIQTYLNAADLVVLPFRDIAHSGSALLALSFDRPVVVPDRGAMHELRDQVGERWVYTYEGDFSPDVLRSSLEWLREVPRPDTAPLQAFGWDKIAERTLDAYHDVLQATGSETNI